MGLPHAELMATRRGRRLFWALRLCGEWLTLLSRRVPSMEQHLGYRHLLIDNQLRRIGPDRVVELGAGLSPRGVEWAADRGVRYHELDLAQMAAAKQRRLDRAPAELRARLDGRHSVECQNVLSEDFDAALAAMLKGARRPAVIAEGVLAYFEPVDRARLAAAIAGALAGCGGSGTFVCDLFAEDEVAKVAGAMKFLRLMIRVSARGQGHTAGFRDATEIERFFGAAGFDSVERLDAADHAREVPELASKFSPVSVYCATVSGGGA